jgi:hypothetical protein
VSRRTCQVFVGTKRCGEPTVDFVEIAGVDVSVEGDTEFLTTRVPMCAYHWDEYTKGRPVKDAPTTRIMKLNDKP